MGDNQQDDDGGDEMKKSSSKKKKKDIDLPITIRVSGLTRNELDRLIQQEVNKEYFKGITRGCAKSVRAHPVEKKIPTGE